MRDVIDAIYQELKTENCGTSIKEFSRDWLCMSSSYYSYLRSTDSHPTIDVLVRLFGRLEANRLACEKAIAESKSPIQRQVAQMTLPTYEKLSSKAQRAIVEYALGVKQTS